LRKYAKEGRDQKSSERARKSPLAPARQRKFDATYSNVFSYFGADEKLPPDKAFGAGGELMKII
jgi:hypothetical protein